MPIGPRARVDPNEVSAPLGATCNRQSFHGISCARMTNLPGVLLLVSVLAVAGCKGTASSQAMNGVVDEQGYFFVGGRYTQTKDGQIMAGQMFVQYQIPRERRHRYPIVMWHGGGQTGTNFLGTPDGRKGWADYFLARGYAVYVVD